MGRKKETLLVIYLKSNKIAAPYEPGIVEDFINHGGADIIVQTDDFISRSIQLFFKDETVHRRVNDVLEQNKYFCMFERISGWATLTGHTAQIEVGVLFAHLLKYINQAGYKVLTSDNWLSNPKPMSVLTA